MNVRTRFAPSPTGFLHIGSVRTALFSWLYARRYAGKVILRIEDTDRERSTDAAIAQILAGLEWAGLDYDEGPFYQTEHFDRYKAVIASMLDAGSAYRCDCTKQELDAMRAAQMARHEKPRYDGRCRERACADSGKAFVVRFKNPLHGSVVVDDAVHGRVSFENAELDDLIIARSDGTPTYNFCVVVDDMDMKITHVIRGDDHLNNTPRQINMFLALGAPIPVYAHLPMILGSDGAKLSKRHGAVSVLQYQDEGYLPGALLNYLVRLGWSHGDDEIFTIEQLQTLFDINEVNKSASAFDLDKLNWINQQHIARSEPADLVAPLQWQLQRAGVDAGDAAKVEAVVRAQQERAKTLKEMAANSVFFFRAPESYDEKAVRKHITSAILSAWDEIESRLTSTASWSAADLHETLQALAVEKALTLGQIAQPLRIAVSGKTVSPPIDVTLEILGREAVSERMGRAGRSWRAAQMS